MALNHKLSNTAANAAADGVCALLNNGYLRIYNGTQPTDPDTAITTQTKLAELRFNATAFSAAVAGVASANAFTPDFNTVAGTASWFRILKSDGTTAIADGTVGVTGCDLNLNTTTIDASGSLSVASFFFTENKT